MGTSPDRWLQPADTQWVNSPLAVEPDAARTEKRAAPHPAPVRAMVLPQEGRAEAALAQLAECLPERRGAEARAAFEHNVQLRPDHAPLLAGEAVVLQVQQKFLPARPPTGACWLRRPTTRVTRQRAGGGGRTPRARPGS